MADSIVAERSGDGTHYSGVLVVSTAGGDVTSLAEDVGRIPGVEVHFVYPERARIIAVLESDSVAGQQRLLDRIRSLQAVVLAEPAYHFVDSMEESDE